MNILVTGGCGFIGSHVVERFIKENHKVCVIDNLSSGKKENISLKGYSFYDMDITDQRCEKVFRSHGFDAVVHLAAQVDVNESVKNPTQDARVNIQGLVNMLNYSKKYGVKKFIFASSAAVYGQNSNLPLKEDFIPEPVSPYGISKNIGEIYCSKWKKLYGLDTVCLRFSNVYGPKQSSTGEGGVISIFLDKLCKGSNIIIHGDGEQTRDFIYIEDLVDAIYRTIYSTTFEILNISTGNSKSINNIVEVLNEFLTVGEIEYKEVRKGDIKHSLLDNTKAKFELDWVPVFSLKEGLEKTYKWYVNQEKYEEKDKLIKENKEDNKTGFLKSLVPLFENIMLFIFFTLITQTNFMNSINIDFMIVYIIAVAIVYGLGQSSIAVFLSTLLYFYRGLMAGYDIPYILYGNVNTLFVLCIYFVIGIGVGYVIDKKNINIRTNNQEYAQLESDYIILNNVYEENVKIRQSLQEQILGYKDSFGKIFSIVSRLDTLEPEEIFNEAVHVISNIMKSGQVRIYKMDKSGNYLRLVSQLPTNKIFKNSLKITENYRLEKVIKDRELLLNTQLESNLPLLTAPILDKEEVIFLVMIDDVPFESISLQYVNMFKIVCSLVSASLIKANRYQNVMEEKKYIKGTTILKKDWFENLLLIKKKGKEQQFYNFSLLRVKDEKLNVSALSDKLSDTIREVDYIGQGNDDKIYILLSNSNKNGALEAIKRIESKGVSVECID